MAEAEKKEEAAGAAPGAELSVKHPLQNAWVLWFDNPVKRLGAKDWSQNLKKVLTLHLRTPVPCMFVLRGRFLPLRGGDIY